MTVALAPAADDANVLVATPEVEERYVHERERAVFSVRDWLTKLGLPRKDVCRTLWISMPSLDNWRHSGYLPRAVWRRAQGLWGNKGFTPKIEQTTKPFRLDVRYADLLKLTLTPISPIAPLADVAPAPPELPAPPATVSWDVFQAVTGLLMHQNAEILAENKLLNADNMRMHKVIGLFKAEVGLETTVNALSSQPRGVPDTRLLAAGIRPEIRNEVKANLEALSIFNGNGAVLSDLQKRIRPFG
jgi:hypothetical protein